jgi:hypothetical protein
LPYLAALIVTYYHELAYTQDWWIKKISITEAVIGFIPSVFGVFFVGTLWVFALTYGNFWLYFIINVVTDFLYAVVIQGWFIQIGIMKNINSSSWVKWLIFVGISIFIYGYQKWQEEIFIKDDDAISNKKGLELHIKLNNPFRKRKKAR